MLRLLFLWKVGHFLCPHWRKCPTFHISLLQFKTHLHINHISQLNIFLVGLLCLWDGVEGGNRYCITLYCCRGGGCGRWGGGMESRGWKGWRIITTDQHTHQHVFFTVWCSRHSSGFVSRWWKPCQIFIDSLAPERLRAQDWLPSYHQHPPPPPPPPRLLPHNEAAKRPLFPVKYSFFLFGSCFFALTVCPNRCQFRCSKPPPPPKMSLMVRTLRQKLSDHRLLSQMRRLECVKKFESMTTLQMMFTGKSLADFF